MKTNQETIFSALIGERCLADSILSNFTLKQLEEIEIRGLTVERDLYFKQENFSSCLKRWKLERGG